MGERLLSDEETQLICIGRLKSIYEKGMSLVENYGEELPIEGMFKLYSRYLMGIHRVRIYDSPKNSKARLILSSLLGNNSFSPRLRLTAAYKINGRTALDTKVVGAYEELSFRIFIPSDEFDPHRASVEYLKYDGLVNVDYFTYLSLNYGDNETEDARIARALTYLQDDLLHV